ncbi:hypothetical protein KAI56_03780 [Candidatus Parcubacteria bacterium]|nr:hypothetical protein [Candidatus Parcubacteria bacterium]
MDTKKLLSIGIVTGLIIIVIFSYFNFGFYDGVIAAIIVGVIIAREADNSPIKYTVISILAYNMIYWTIMAFFDQDMKMVLGYENKAIPGLFVGTIIIMIILFSFIGSFSAFVVYNLKKSK